MKLKTVAAVSVGAVLSLAGPASAANWPTKPITITIGFGAGGTTDVVARAVADKLAGELGQPVVVENKPGAGGDIAATALTQQAPDGYNLVATTSTTITLDPFINKLSYTLDDFTYVAAIGEFPEAYVALPSKGWKTIKDATAVAKTTGQMTVASNSSLDKLLTTHIAKHDGVKLSLVPTRSGAEVVTQVMGGHVDMGYSSGAYYPQAKNGQLVVLALLGNARLKSMPDVPTLKELGYGVSSTNLILFVAPKNLPKDVAAKLGKAFQTVGESGPIQELLANRSVNPIVLTGEALEKTAKEHGEGYKELVKTTRGTQ
jgi:tripartite-type tricarboxylate transporter receptor subunit TctC